MWGLAWERLLSLKIVTADMKMPLVIGFTGRMGSGKSTAGQFFKNLGVPVIDTDQLARDVVLPGSKAYQHILQYFGPTCLQKNHSLDRRALRTLIFNDAAAKHWLEQLLHPLIEARLRHMLKTCQAAYAVVLIPLLVDRPLLNIIDRILVIDSDHVQQRILARDAIDVNLSQKILDSQATREQLRNAADDILLNNGTLAELQQQVLQLHSYYLQLSQRTDITALQSNNTHN